MKKNVFSLLLMILVIYSCSNDSNEEQEEEMLQDILVEVLLFEFIADTGNDSQRLRYEIEFTNPNGVDIRGGYEITTNADGLVSTQFFSTNAPCTEIGANSDCTISFDEEEPFEQGLATVQSIELVSAKYVVVE
ncbi:hypothetical protein LV716_01460 [Flagellimonas sp. HMM57]|uniref:hypothetical protein n=1 Tax=unclassified Flagellimonas TaxID=2644544 RepID=UPI0013D753A2|nr:MULTISPECIES: hypothetical protein [unclassified Flagellimonas]UII76482.1 hypothetical protein LV716_01460 [Flagellimonas sp. HMM57]